MPDLVRQRGCARELAQQLLVDARLARDVRENLDRCERMPRQPTVIRDVFGYVEHVIGFAAARIHVQQGFLDTRQGDRTVGGEVRVEEQILLADRPLDYVQTVEHARFEFRFARERRVGVEGARRLVNYVQH